MNKELLKLFYLLKEEIREVQDNIVPKKYLECWFIYLEELNNRFYNLYEHFDDAKEYTALECLQDLMEKKWTWDTSKLTEEHRKKYEATYTKWNYTFEDGKFNLLSEDTIEEKCIMMTADFYKECKYCFIPLETLDECLDYMESKQWL